MNIRFRSQHTIERVATVVGFGYWSGEDVRVEFHPAAANTGVVFIRTDLPGAPRIPARVALRIETPRRTTLRSGEFVVEMVEHVLAALAGLEIDNCEVRVTAGEMPGCDGSALAFVQALREAGVEAQAEVRPFLCLHETIRVGDEDCWVEARPTNTAGLIIKYRLDYGSGNAIGRETIELPINPKSFCESLAPARTFLLEAEANWLRERGLGGRTSHKDLLVFGDDGPIDNELRFEDECVRHKTLDVVGDLALAGCDIHGRIVAHRSGHRLNAELVKVLLLECHVERDQRRSA